MWRASTCKRTNPTTLRTPRHNGRGTSGRTCLRTKSRIHRGAPAKALDPQPHRPTPDRAISTQGILRPSPSASGRRAGDLLQLPPPPRVSKCMSTRFPTLRRGRQPPPASPCTPPGQQHARDDAAAGGVATKPHCGALASSWPTTAICLARGVAPQHPHALLHANARGGGPAPTAGAVGAAAHEATRAEGALTASAGPPHPSAPTAWPRLRWCGTKLHLPRWPRRPKRAASSLAAAEASAAPAARHPQDSQDEAAAVGTPVSNAWRYVSTKAEPHHAGTTMSRKLMKRIAFKEVQECSSHHPAPQG